MLRVLQLSAVAALAAASAAQTTSVVPAICARLPGNAALSMPLRWSHGTMQVFVDATLLPAGFVGQSITGVRFRRPTFLEEPAYAALQRTLTVRGGFQPAAPSAMVGTITQNRPTNTLVLFGPASVTSAAVAAPGSGTSTGDELLHVVFTQPLPVTAGSLFLEFEVSDAPLQISADHWVDAVWFQHGIETGYAVTLGAGGCTTRTEPTHLRWNGSQGPGVGGTAALELTGAPPTNATSTGLVLAWAGLDPATRPPGLGYLGFGASLTTLDPGLTGCNQWAPLDLSWSGTTDAFGKFAVTLPLTGATVGLQIGVQTGWFDASRTGLPFSFSNGVALVLNSVGVDNRCSTMFFPAGVTASPWPAFVGQMPVLLLDH